MAIADLVDGRSVGLHRSLPFSRLVTTTRGQFLRIDPREAAHPMHSAGITALSVDPVHDRYLVVAELTGAVSLYDLASRKEETGELRPLATRAAADGPGDPAGPGRAGGGGTGATRAGTRQQRRSATGTGAPAESTADRAHYQAVSAVCWRAVDSGLFVTSGFDSRVLVWDAAAFRPVFEFSFDCKVFDVALSPVASRHSLVAGASDQSVVRLCDLRSGAFTHSLTGHKDAITCVTWSPRSEFELVSGARDGCIHLWDVRKSGSGACVGALDERNQQGKTKPRGRHRRTDATPMLSVSTGVAHRGRVTSLHFPEHMCGRRLLSCGADTLRMWDMDTMQNTLVNFGSIANAAQVRTDIVSAEAPGGGTLVYHAQSGAEEAILAFDVDSGELVDSLEGHYSPCSAMAMRTTVQELYTGGRDGMLHLWSSSFLSCSGDDTSRRVVGASVSAGGAGAAAEGGEAGAEGLPAGQEMPGSEGSGDEWSEPDGGL